MKNPARTFVLIGCWVCVSVSLVASQARAGEWDRKTAITFSQPVAIPGIVLPAGTYVFDFLGSTADRNLIEVLSQDEQKVYATIEAIPDYRANATGETLIVFEERKAGAPQAIREWFFPDRRYGHLFVYPGIGKFELGRFKEPESTNNLVESAGLQFTKAPSAKTEASMMIEHLGQMAQSEDTPYLRALHQKQKEAYTLTKSDKGVNKPVESAGLSYMQALHQKQANALK